MMMVTQRTPQQHSIGRPRPPDVVARDKKVASIIQRRPGIRIGEIADRAKVSRSLVSQSLIRLSRDRLIESRDGHRWWAVEDEEEA